MRCPACSSESFIGARFCGACGNSLDTLCPHCQSPNQAQNLFCTQCGHPLNPVWSQGPVTLPTPPAHLAHKILAQRGRMEGERKYITAMFADVVGSLELIRDWDPEQTHDLWARAIRLMANAVHEYEGTVVATMGDGVFALFGAPIAHEDHAIR